MFSPRVNSLRRFGLASLLVLGGPAFAQQGVQFSTPVQDDDATKPPESVVTATHKTPGSFNAPRPVFGDGPSASFDQLPQAPRIDNPQWRKAREDQANWALLTPEQILGIPTPESILGIADRSDAKLSPDERFLKRKDAESAAAATKGRLQEVWGARQGVWSVPMAGADDSPFARSANGYPPGSDADRNSSPFSSQDASPLAGQDPSAGLAASQRDSVWTGPFEIPPAPPKPTPDQIEDMDRFRALLAPADKPTTAAASSFAGPAAAAPVRDPNFTVQPAYNPAGSSVKPLVTGIGLPTGLTPLAGVAGLPPVPAKRAPLVQPPPWLTDPTALSPLPQRQY